MVRLDIDPREVQVSQRQADIVWAAMSATFEVLQLTADQRDLAFRTLHSQLRQAPRVVRGEHGG
jgi:hypothetical protein